ncbi:hypothetical protein FVEN_g1447 [Fusarium venenatum]|uniref:TRF2-interacting telomeric protein/Rap1 C terminal domain-containing protein n=1 Tax=Fusarium venenatum TaxID=56646 RepID=UPI001D7A0CB6|nr:hypothetical protein FVEN_g1447 [Fusarium venenatum]KAH6979896.1 TRF2-interacting telomeric protein/Rap1 C terminal domain-containing protein [Fusarium venenatum]
MTTVVYDGVQGEGGTIFKDVKFWVAHRVPIRSVLLEQIKQNGGSVVSLEKQADMLIADHAIPKHAPHKSYSWKFIDDSVKNGYIQLKDQYLIERHPEEPRRAGSHPSKSTRTPFTKEDDARIARWALDHPTEQKGNRIWQEYEQINGRHTAQSWRDRFIKKLVILDRNTLERMAASASTEIPPENRNAVQKEQALDLTERSLQQPAAQKQRNGSPEDTLLLDTAPDHTKETSLPPKTEEVESPVQHHPAFIELDRKERGRVDFNLDFNQWLHIHKKEVKRHWLIGDTSIELFDLGWAIQETNDPTSIDIDWAKVTENLGFENPDAYTISEVFRFFKESLEEFLRSVRDFNTDEEEEEEDMYEEHVKEEEPASDPEAAPGMSLTQETDWEDVQDEGPPQSYERSSPPITISGLKRSADRELTSSDNARKRRRFDPDMEIPTTTEAELTPEVVPARNPSPSALVSSQWQDYVGESEASQHLPPLPPHVEGSPELGISVIPQRETLHQFGESTPPEGETMDFTPMPFDLDTSHHERPSASKRLESLRQRDNSLTSELTLRRAVPSTKADSNPTARSVVRRSIPTSFNSSRNPTPRKPPPRDSLPRGSDPSNSQEIQKWISHYQLEGFSRRVVVEGLRRTTLTPGKMALLVMKHLSEGCEVPSRHEGIWTDRDDGDLKFSMSVDFSRSPANEKEEQDQDLAQKAHNRLIKKHGKQRFELRKSFLEAQTEKGHGSDR